MSFSMSNIGYELTNDAYYNPPTNRGRIAIPSVNPEELFKLYEKVPVKECVTFRNATAGLWDETMLSKLFFSKENIQLLQNAIRSGVYEKSNKQYIVKQQDCDTLKIIMRSVFLQVAQNQPTNITEQIKALNKYVIDYCIHEVYEEAKMYIRYLSDISTMYTPNDRPIIPYESKQLEMKPWF